MIIFIQPTINDVGLIGHECCESEKHCLTVVG